MTLAFVDYVRRILAFLKGGGFKSEEQHLTNKVRCFAWEIGNISNFRQMSAFA
jgi:hypothetical protein